MQVTACCQLLYTDYINDQTPLNLQLVPLIYLDFKPDVKLSIYLVNTYTQYHLYCHMRVVVILSICFKSISSSSMNVSHLTVDQNQPPTVNVVNHAILQFCVNTAVLLVLLYYSLLEVSTPTNSKQLIMKLLSM